MSPELSRVSIVTQVLARHSSEAGITGFAMAILCAICGVVYLIASFICLLYLWDNPGLLLANNSLAWSATGLACSILAFAAMRFWWRENFRWALRLTTLLFVVTAIVLHWTI